MVSCLFFFLIKKVRTLRLEGFFILVFFWFFSPLTALPAVWVTKRKRLNDVCRLKGPAALRTIMATRRLDAAEQCPSLVSAAQHLHNISFLLCATECINKGRKQEAQTFVGN